MQAELIGKRLNRLVPLEVDPKIRPRVLMGGIATLEILIAFTIFILCISAVIIVNFGNQSIAIDSQIKNEAITKAQEMLEKARADSRFDFNLVNSSTTTETNNSLVFIKNLNVVTSDTDPTLDLWTKRVTSKVTWQTAGRTLDTIFSTLLTNKEAVSGGDTCSSVLTGDWTNPEITSYEFGKDVLNDTSSDFPIKAIQTFDQKMYIAVNNVAGNNDETFFILDITDPILTLSDVLGKLDNSPGTISEGINALAVDGKQYVYVANAYDSSPSTCVENHNCAQLQVIDVSNPNNPFIARNFKISSFTSGNKLVNGNSLFYKDGIVYLGLANATNGKEFFIIDVGGSGVGTPTNPVILSNIEIGNGINSIFVRNNYAYIISPNTQELKIFNITDLSNPSPAGNFNASSGSGNGKSIILVGNKLYLGKTVPNAGNDFHILNNSNPNIILPEIGGINSSSSINGIIIKDFLTFFITSNGQFQTWNISNPNNISQYATPLILPPGSGVGLQGTATDCEKNYIYVGSKNSDNKGYISVITSN